MLIQRKKPNSKTARLAGGVLALTAVVLTMPGEVFAAGGNHNCGTGTFFDWGCNTTNDSQIGPVLNQILMWLAFGVAIAVVGGIIYGAIQYTTSGGNQAQAQKAISTIRNAVIALVLYFAMWALLNWLVPGGVFHG